MSHINEITKDHGSFSFTRHILRRKKKQSGNHALNNAMIHDRDPLMEDDAGQHFQNDSQGKHHKSLHSDIHRDTHRDIHQDINKDIHGNIRDFHETLSIPARGNLNFDPNRKVPVNLFSSVDSNKTKGDMNRSENLIENRHDRVIVDGEVAVDGVDVSLNDTMNDTMNDTLNDSFVPFEAKDIPSNGLANLQLDDGYPLFRNANVLPPPNNFYTVREHLTHLEHCRLNSENKNNNSQQGSSSIRSVNSDPHTISFDFPPVELIFKNDIDAKEVFLETTNDSFLQSIRKSIVNQIPALSVVFIFIDIWIQAFSIIFVVLIHLWSIFQCISEYLTPLQYLVGCFPFNIEKDSSEANGTTGYSPPFVFALNKKELKLACAVGKGSNQIRVYDIRTKQYGKYDLNSSEHRAGIRQIVWNPYDINQLLAVCRHGICVWDTAARVGQRVGKCCFLQLENAVSANYILDPIDDSLCIIAVSSSSDRIYIWKFDNGWQLYQKRSTFLGALEAVCPSPSSTFIAVHPFRHGKLQFYNSFFDQKQAWFVDDRIQSGVWSPNERFYIFATKNDSNIHILEFHQSRPILRMSYKFALSFDAYNDEYTGETLCGTISLISIHNNRMAVAFKDSDLIAVVACDLEVLNLQPHLFRPIGFIRPYKRSVDPDEVKTIYSDSIDNAKSGERKLIDMQFFENFQSGSLLVTLHGEKQPLLTMYKLES